MQKRNSARRFRVKDNGDNMSTVVHTIDLEGNPVIVAAPEPWDGQLAFVLAHGTGQNMDSPFMSFFHSGIAQLGFLSVKFNFAYMQEGRRAPDSQKKLQATYAAVVERVTDEFDPSVMVAGGKSMGGRVASYLARDFSSIGGLLFLGYPLHPPGQPQKLRDAHLYSLPQPMLFISGTRDTLAQSALLQDVVGKIGSRATLHSVDGGDHSLRVRKAEPDGMGRAIEVIGEWSGQFL